MNTIFCISCGYCHNFYGGSDTPRKCSSCGAPFTQNVRMQLVEPPDRQPQLVSRDDNAPGTMIFKASFDKPVEGQLIAILEPNQGLFRGKLETELEKLRKRVSDLEQLNAERANELDEAGKEKKAALLEAAELRGKLSREKDSCSNLYHEKEKLKVQLRKFEKDVARLRAVFGEKAFMEALKEDET